MTLHAVFTRNQNEVTTGELFQWDTGQQLCIEGLTDIDENTKVHFANNRMSQAIVKTGVYENDTLTVDIPNEFLQSGGVIHGRAWVYVNENTAVGQTIRTINIPIVPRARPNDYVSPADPDSKGIVEQALEILRDGTKVSYVTNVTVDNATETGKVYYTTVGSSKALIVPVSGDSSQAQFRLDRDGKIYARRRSRSSTSVDFPAWGTFEQVEWKQSEIENMIATYLANVKVQSITAQSTHDQIPTAKAVYDWTGNYINVLTDRETALDGIVSQEWEIGMRYLVNGVETWSGTSTSRMSTKPGTYIRFNKDDLIVMKKTMDYQFLVVYSTDNGSTWTSTLNRTLPYSILEDSIGWICIGKKSGTFTEEEMQSVVNHYFFILRKGTGEIKKNALLADALSIASGSFDRSEIIDSKYGFTYQDAKTTDTVVLSYDLLLPEFEASKGDIFAIKASISIDYPDMYSNIGVRIYERYNGNTVKTTDITDISDTIIYTVSNSNADAIHIRGLLLADEGDITTRHYEIFDYKISVVKKLPGEIEELLIEAGDIWEV